MASRIRLAMSWWVTTARTSNLPPQRAEALTSGSNVPWATLLARTVEVDVAMRSSLSPDRQPIRTAQGSMR